MNLKNMARNSIYVLVSIASILGGIWTFIQLKDYFSNNATSKDMIIVKDEKSETVPIVRDDRKVSEKMEETMIKNFKQ